MTGSSRISAGQTFAGFAAAALVGTSLTIMAVDAKADHPPGKGGTLRAHLNRTISGFDHIKVPRGGLARGQVLNALHETLFRVNLKTGGFDPQLAVKATPSDNFRRWRVTLRDGVKFAKPLTSYAHHFGRLLGGKLAQRYRNFLGMDLRRVVAIDRLTIEFQMGKPAPAFMASASAAQYVPVVSKRAGFCEEE